ncbi:MAG: glycosyltransferase family 1 protein [Paenibacillus sp.]|nr:glycosyltransferase family 1 protein [Paenibacillus sp.]
MKIAIIAPGQIPVPPRVGGSVEHCIAQIAKRMAARHHVTVYSRRSSGYAGSTKKGKLHIARVKGGGTKRYLGAVLQTIGGRSFDWIQVDNRPSSVPVVRKRYPKSRIALFLHSKTFVTPPNTSISTAAKQMAQANLIIANSKSLAATLRSLFPRLRHKVRVVTLGVDPVEFRPPTPAQRAAVRARYGATGKFAVLFAGRLVPIKGADVLIKAMAYVRRSIPNAKLYIAGGAGKRAYVQGLKRLAASRGVPVQYLGYVPRKRMPATYWLADCFVCPSQGLEAFGLVNVEAMACGTPCIASRNGGIREIIRHGQTGRLVTRYRSAQAFAEQINSAAVNRQATAAMAQRARKAVVGRFGWSSTAAKLGRIYQSNRA